MVMHAKRKRRVLAPAALAVTLALGVVLGCATSAGAASRGTVSSLPNACKLLKRAEAQALVGTRLQPAVGYGTNCTYNPYPTGRVAQVSIYVDPGVPRTLTIDRQLKHTFWRVPGIGDQALVEEANIFARKGRIWITIHVVPLEPWPAYRRRLERAARIAISRVPPSARRAAAASVREAARPHDPPASGGRERWTGSERRFGGSITHYAGVVYQPGVVVIGGGARAVRSRSADGLTWTIDAGAPGAGDLRVGKIMLATTFAAGRVLKVTRAGSNLRVVLGPVALTDVIRDGTFESTKPIPLARPLTYRTALPAPHRRTPSASTTSSDFTADAFWRDGGGVGVSILHDSPTGRLAATVQLYMARPNVTFRIRIGGGKLVDAGLELRGVGGVRYEIFGATLDGSGNVTSPAIPVGESFTFPLVGPLAVTLSQAFDVSMQFAGRATMKTAGDYLIQGTLGFGYKGQGSPERTDSKMTKRARVPISENTLSLGVGSNAFKVGWKVRATVGLGIGGFSAGAFGELRAGLGIDADGSNLLSLELGCSKVSLDVTSNYGVGYTLPNYILKPVNALLRLFGAKPIPTSGGPSWGPFSVWKPPQAEWCPPRKPPSRT